MHRQTWDVSVSFDPRPGGFGRVYDACRFGSMLDSPKRSLWQSLVAVLAGNAIYFSVERFLPVRAQHQIYQIDWGLAVDFWMCLVCYGLVRLRR